LPALEFFPVRLLILSRLSAFFVWLIPFQEPPESSAPCWRTVATVYPLGNCDSLRLETCLSYLTRFGMVSQHSSSLSSFFACTDSARTSDHASEGTPLLRPWRSQLPSPESLRVGDRVSSYALPLSQPPLRAACLRLFDGDSGSGLAPEVFPAVSSQPFDIDVPRQIFSCHEPCRLPCGEQLGVLRVVLWSHAASCDATRASRFTLAFSLRRALRPLFRCPGVPRSSHEPCGPQACASYPDFALRIDPPSASPLLPRPFHLASFAFHPVGFRLRSSGPVIFPSGFCRHT